ncbi:hypothetical protein [Mycobacteroides abscessus]|uniref:hypothetical protein n=1 Tax=Mycobacteroides abscessus TaxID=36809 RepID=UPI0009A882B8|nr:hypothetical protein [Mycobacteroides abscessus]
MRTSGRKVLSITVAGEISRPAGQQIPADVHAAVADLPRAVYAAGGMDNRGEFIIRLARIDAHLTRVSRDGSTLKCGGSMSL